MGKTRRFSFVAIWALPFVLTGSASWAGPAAPQRDAKAAPRDAKAPGVKTVPSGDGVDRGADVRQVPSIRTRLEGSMAELGEMAEQAKRDGDMVRAACVEAALKRGRNVMEVATGELLVIRDARSTEQQKSFAVEKLAAAADRLEALVDEAKTCAGDQAPEDEDNVTRTEVDETQTIPVLDPTRSPAQPPVPPAVDQTQPQTVASPSV